MNSLDPSTLQKLIPIDAVDLSLLRMIQDHLTYQEMAEKVDRRARSGVYRRIERLIKLGLIEKKSLKSRSRRLTDAGQELLRRLPVADGTEPA